MSVLSRYFVAQTSVVWPRPGNKKNAFSQADNFQGWSGREACVSFLGIAQCAMDCCCNVTASYTLPTTERLMDIYCTFGFHSYSSVATVVVLMCGRVKCIIAMLVFMIRLCQVWLLSSLHLSGLNCMDTSTIFGAHEKQIELFDELSVQCSVFEETNT